MFITAAFEATKLVFTNFDPGLRLSYDGPIMDQLPALYEIHRPDDVDALAACLIKKKKTNEFLGAYEEIGCGVEWRADGFPDLLLQQRYTVPDGS